MQNTKREMRMEELREWAEYIHGSLKEAAFDLLYSFYGAAGFWQESLERELRTKSEEELIEWYCTL